MTDIRVGMGQMEVVPGQPERNLQKAVVMIEEAARQGCAIVVLPECLDLGWTYPEAGAQAKPLPGPFSMQLANAAKENNLYVAAGLTEREGSLLYNSSILLDPNGDILLKHRKINELSIASMYTTGEKLGVVSTPIGKIGMNICADNLPETVYIGHTIGKMGAQILLSPSAWAVPSDYDHAAEPYGIEWKTSYTELALAHRMPVVGVSNVGPVIGGAWDGWKCIGCSLAVDQHGKIVAEGLYGEKAEELIIAQFSL